MELDKRNAWAEFFASYNRNLGEQFDSELSGIEDPEIMDAPGFDDAIRSHVLHGMHAWYSLPIQTAGGQTPQGMIDRIDTLDEAMEVFRMAAVQCDEELPDLLRTKLGTYGVRAVDRLLPLVFASVWDAPENADEDRPDDLLVSCAALRLLGDWKAAETFELVLSRFLATEEPEEMVSESFISYCNGIGPATAPALQQALLQAAAAGHDLSGPYEYAVIALSGVGRMQPSDSIFLCLRECFRKMERKVIGAICLGDYGDGRAIPTLKGYLDRNSGQIDRQLFYEVLSAIKRLGGDISDIHDPFGDFGPRRNSVKQ